MGDIVSLVEKAAEAIDEEEAARMEEKLRGLGAAITRHKEGAASAETC